MVVYKCSWFNNPFELLLGTPHEPQIDHEHVSMFDLFRENGYEPGYLLKNLMNNFTILFYLHYHSISSFKIEKNITHTHTLMETSGGSGLGLHKTGHRAHQT